jgi:tripartite-type tricarboxylate transporter receptor subunit TctC
MKGRTLCLAAVFLLGFTSVNLAQVKDYPKKPIQIVVAHAAGSTIDIFCRTLADEVSRIWKVPVNCINKVTASGSVAASEVARYPRFTPEELGWKQK